MNRMLSTKRRIIGLLVISCFIGIGFVNVKALSLNKSNKTTAEAKSLAGCPTSRTLTCNNIKSTYDLKITPIDGEKASVKITYKHATGRTANDFKVYYNKGTASTLTQAAVTFTRAGNTYSATVEIDDNNKSDESSADVFVVSNNNRLCCEMTTSEMKDIAKEYDEKGNLNSIKDSNGNIIGKYHGKSVYVSTIIYSNGEGDDIDYGEVEEDSADAIAYESEFTYGDTSKWDSEEWTNNVTEKTMTTSNEIDLSPSICKTFDVPEMMTTSKGKKKPITYSSLPEGDKDKYFVNKEKYKARKTTVTDGTFITCERTCEELITVEYGPPVKAMAGLCFEYVVKVTSKEVCYAHGKEKSRPEKSKFKTCVVYPKCNNQEVNWDQAGPNAAFDSCVKKCDNGKYSKNCTDKCYKEVYNKKTTKTKATASTTSKGATKVNVPDKCTDILCNNSPSVNINDLVAAALKSNEGYYDYSSRSDRANSLLKWNQGTKYWTTIGRYYLANAAKAQQTVTAITTKQGEAQYGSHYNYYIDTDGFKRAILHNGKSCSQNCHWYVKNKGSCSRSAIDQNAYYSLGVKGTYKLESNGKTYYNVHVDSNQKVFATPSSSGDYVFLNKEDANFSYAQLKAIYKKEKEECKSVAYCEKTKQSTFTISVNYDGSNTQEYPISGKDMIQVVGTKPNLKRADDNNTTILNKDTGTCLEEEKPKPFSYHIDWSFPGTWMDNKTGAIEFKTPQNTTGWQLYEDKFCLPLNIKTRYNTDWYSWRLAYDEMKQNPGKAEYVTAEQTKKAIAETKEDQIVYNIIAKAVDFGRFNWNITVKCFFGTPPDDTTSDPFEYRVRSVDLGNLFPAEGAGSSTGNTKKDETITNSKGETAKVGQQPAYNWTNAVESTEIIEGVGGTNPSANEKYVVDPVELIDHIQKSADPNDPSVEPTYSNSNIEYEFNLTMKALKYIRDYYNKFKQKNYINFSNSTIGDKKGDANYMGKLSYKSPLIDELEDTNGTPARRRKIGCNNWNSKNGKCEVGD